MLERVPDTPKHPFESTTNELALAGTAHEVKQQNVSHVERKRIWISVYVMGWARVLAEHLDRYGCYRIWTLHCECVCIHFLISATKATDPSSSPLSVGSFTKLCTLCHLNISHRWRLFAALLDAGRRECFYFELSFIASMSRNTFKCSVAFVSFSNCIRWHSSEFHCSIDIRGWIIILLNIACRRLGSRLKLEDPWSINEKKARSRDGNLLVNLLRQPTRNDTPQYAREWHSSGTMLEEQRFIIRTAKTSNCIKALTWVCMYDLYVHGDTAIIIIGIA